jgi:hypothetical protein
MFVVVCLLFVVSRLFVLERVRTLNGYKYNFVEETASFSMFPSAPEKQ